MTNWKDKALAATRGSQFGAILSAATDTEIPAPSFSGKASITSDSFVMCNFTKANGENHMGAFVGGASDLVRNTQGLAKHLKLDDAERAELFATVRNWIGQDYSGGKALKDLQ